MHSRLIGAVLAASSVLGLGQAVADSGQPNLSAIKSQVQQSCKSDLDKFCKDITPGNGRIASCLNSREDQLSSGCRQTWDNAKSDVSNRMDQARIEFHQSCGSDVQKYCSNVAAGRGRLYNCLDRHRGDLSNSCQQFEAKLQRKLEEFVG